MKKIFILILLTGLLSGCAAGTDESLFGEWLWDTDGSYSLIFNYDGTGERGYPDTRDTFSWSTSGGRLNIRRDHATRREIRDEAWDFELYDNILTITNHPQQERQYSYHTAVHGQNEDLLGTWFWDLGETHSYTFNYDGTGYRGFPNETEAFTWAADNYRLTIIRDSAPHGEIRGELWLLDISPDSFSITSIQEDGLSFNYFR